MEILKAKTMSNLMAIVAAICIVESGGDASAVGDNGQAIGAFQIHPIMIAEANRLAGFDLWTLQDRWSLIKSRQICHQVLAERLRRRGLSADTEEGQRYAIGIWNSGEAYYRKVKGAMGSD